MTSNPASLVKLRALVGRLSRHGIEATRATTSREDPSAPGPDAMLVAQDGRAWIVAFWTGTTVQPSLLDAGDHAAPTLDATALALAGWWRRQRQSIEGPCPDLLILAPDLPSREVPSGGWWAGTDVIPVIKGRACKKAETLAESILSHFGEVLPPETLAHWRAATVPEVRIEQPWRRTTVTRPETVLAAPLLLDYKQERCARLDLELDPEAARTARDLTLRVVTGVAGCGKTLVLVHRAALLASHFPKARVLLVSFNRPLINDLRRRLARHPAAARIHCLTFYQWLGRVAPPRGEMLPPYEIVRWIARDRRANPLPALEKMSDRWLHEELTWMCDHNLAGEPYLSAERKGRGTKLSIRQRSEMLALLSRFRAWLRQEDHGDWSEWALAASEHKPAALAGEQFDHLLIDEAQFFAPVWLDLLRAALKPGGHLFLCADPTQGFLRRGHSWSSLGLDVRQRSHRLERPYRSTRAILEFARGFYQRRLPGDDEPLNLPSPEWMETVEPGAAPIVLPAGRGHEQLARLEAELRALAAQGTPGGHVIILTAGRSLGADTIIAHLNTRLHSGAASSLKSDSIPESAIGVAHLMAATGLERPIVFLLGLDELAAEERDATLTDDERAEKHLSHTRQIYVGITRAMDRLVIYASDPAMVSTLLGPPAARTLAAAG